MLIFLEKFFKKISKERWNLKLLKKYIKIFLFNKILFKKIATTTILFFKFLT